MDFPLHHPKLSDSDTYPPKIVLQALPSVQDPQTTTCSIKVQGFSEDMGFNLLISKRVQKGIGGKYFVIWQELEVHGMSIEVFDCIILLQL